jgi:predicted O-methyltransferase YrrM
MWGEIKFDENWLPEIRKNFAYCETLREKAAFNTGSISEKSAMVLRGLTEHFKPKTIVEVGTFIGNSTLSMKADHIYTCDYSNDCFRDRKNITTFPLKTSTEMFADLHNKKHVLVDLFFFDGRLSVFDLPLILSLSHRETVYAFDDFDYAKDGRLEKGVVNARFLMPCLPTHELHEPFNDLPGEGRSTIAVAALRAF